MMTCLCSCERGGDALTGRGWYPGKPFLFVVLLDTCIFDTFALAAALLSISGFTDRRSRQYGRLDRIKSATARQENC